MLAIRGASQTLACRAPRRRRPLRDAGAMHDVRGGNLLCAHPPTVFRRRRRKGRRSGRAACASSRRRPATTPRTSTPGMAEVASAALLRAFFRARRRALIREEVRARERGRASRRPLPACFSRRSFSDSSSPMSPTGAVAAGTPVFERRLAQIFAGGRAALLSARRLLYSACWAPDSRLDIGAASLSCFWSGVSNEPFRCVEASDVSLTTSGSALLPPVSSEISASRRARFCSGDSGQAGLPRW